MEFFIIAHRKLWRTPNRKKGKNMVRKSSVWLNALAIFPMIKEIVIVFYYTCVYKKVVHNYLLLSCTKISCTSQSRIKHKVSRVSVVMGSPFLILCIVFADIPCLKIKLYSVMFFLCIVSNNGLYDINKITSYIIYVTKGVCSWICFQKYLLAMTNCHQSNYLQLH